MTDKIKRFWRKQWVWLNLHLSKCDHILLQGLENAAGTPGSSAYCCHGEDSRIVIIATNVEVMGVFANAGL